VTHDPSIIVVTPVYEDREVARRLCRELAAELGTRVHVVAVDDGSVRQPLDTEVVRDAGLEGSVVRLRRNVGHQRAIAVGLNYVAETFPGVPCVVMDSDGEDLPSTVRDLQTGLASSDIDVVVARRLSRVESLRFKLFYTLYKLVFSFLTGREISFGNFMAIQPSALRRLVSMPELGVHVAGAVLLSKLRISLMPIRRGPRYAGQSKMNFNGLVLHGFRALTVFAEDVQVRVGVLCAIVAALSLTGIAVAFLLKLVGFATPGWSSVALGILVLTLLQTGALSLMSLMMTGVLRNAMLVPPNYQGLIDQVFQVRSTVGGLRHVERSPDPMSEPIAAGKAAAAD
jgi:polyisoprenyl-phosphate glycosyltransferase